MKKVYLLLLGCCLLVAACAGPQRDTAFQTSTIDALLAGVYDGELTGAELLKHGDFGIGTFDGLDGEMIVLDGTIFQVRADGKVYRPELSVKTPFATVCRFSPDRALSVPAGTDFKALEALLDRRAPNRNLFYAIRLTGRFRFVRTRSVPGQQKPYPPLVEVTRNQPEFEMHDVSGTVVGFRCPAYVKGINVPGYHLHFLDDARTKGGHILKIEIEEAFCEVDMLDRYALKLPVNTTAFADTDLSRDRSAELTDVEN
jgi:acetolactate decarboxylase